MVKAAVLVLDTVLGSVKDKAVVDCWGDSDERANGGEPEPRWDVTASESGGCEVAAEGVEMDGR